MLLKLVPQDTNLQFIKLRFAAYVLSAIMIIGSGVLYFSQGLNFGIDFKGGFLIEAHTEQAADLAELRSLTGGLGLGDVSLQTFGEDNQILIRIEYQEDRSLEEVVALVQMTLENGYSDTVSFQRTEAVGPKVSGELIEAGVLSVLLAVGAVLFYIWVRFEWQFGLGAVIALVHDVLLTVGMFSLTQLEFNLSIIAAILTIVGYSLNDTIVVFDRIRDNLVGKKQPDMQELMNTSINQTLSRTVVTSLTTLFVVGVIYFFSNNETLQDFSFPLLIGIVVGTYSSIFIASPTLLWWHKKIKPVTL